MVLTQIITRIYKDPFTLRYPSTIDLWLVLQIWYTQVGSLMQLLLMLIIDTVRSPPYQTITGQCRMNPTWKLPLSRLVICQHIYNRRSFEGKEQHWVEMKSAHLFVPGASQHVINPKRKRTPPNTISTFGLSCKNTNKTSANIKPNTWLDCASMIRPVFGNRSERTSPARPPKTLPKIFPATNRAIRTAVTLCE